MNASLPLLLWLLALGGVATVDVTAYLAAAARAQALADAAALAAVSVEAGGFGAGAPVGSHAGAPVGGGAGAEARRVVAAGGGRLEVCRCAPGTDPVRTEVSVAVPGLVVPRLGAARVRATAEATLVPP